MRVQIWKISIFLISIVKNPTLLLKTHLNFAGKLLKWHLDLSSYLMRYEALEYFQKFPIYCDNKDVRWQCHLQTRCQNLNMKDVLKREKILKISFYSIIVIINADNGSLYFIHRFALFFASCWSNFICSVVFIIRCHEHDMSSSTIGIVMTSYKNKSP